MDSKMLLQMLEELASHHRNKKDLLPIYVNTRLDKSLKNYYEELLNIYDSLVRKDAAKVLKKMNREEKR